MKTKRTVPYNYLPKQFPPFTNIGGNEITVAIIDRIQAVAERGDFTLGKEVGDFEEAWATATGADHAIGMSNGTDAIAVALDAAGMEVGAEVVTSPVSFIATAGAIIQAGGRPKFVDVDSPIAPNIVAKSIPADVLANSKWFLPVLWAGSPHGIADWNTIEGATVVLDAAQGVNALVDGKKLGELRNISAAAYSLHPLKNINVWGDGGMISTNHRSIDYNSRLLRNHGLADRNNWTRPGFNSRLSTVQAAVGLEVLPSMDAMTSQRERNARYLIDHLGVMFGVSIPYIASENQHGWHLFQILVDDPSDRVGLVKYLNYNGVEAKVHYDTPLHLQEAMRPLGHVPGEFPNAEAFCARNVTLPIHEYLDQEDMDYTLEVLRSWSEAGA